MSERARGWGAAHYRDIGPLIIALDERIRRRAPQTTASSETRNSIASRRDHGHLNLRRRRRSYRRGRDKEGDDGEQRGGRRRELLGLESNSSRAICALRSNEVDERKAKGSHEWLDEGAEAGIDLESASHSPSASRSQREPQHPSMDQGSHVEQTICCSSLNPPHCRRTIAAPDAEGLEHTLAGHWVPCTEIAPWSKTSRKTLRPWQSSRCCPPAAYRRYGSTTPDFRPRRNPDACPRSWKGVASSGQVKARIRA